LNNAGEGMNILVIYYSKYGNTKRIAESIADTFRQSVKTCLLSIDQLSVDDLQGIDLVVVGSPTHYQAVPKYVRSVLKSLPKHSLRGKWVATFDTSLKMWDPIMMLSASHGVMSRLRKLGGKRLLKPESFLVTSGDSQEEVGNNNEIDLLINGELRCAEEWAQIILDKLTL
jgi:flavodoxin